MIALRELQRGDLAFLVDVRNECRAMLHNDDVYTVAEAEAWFETTRPRFYLITDAATPIGYFRTSHWDERNRHVYAGCDLHPDYRGKGLARAAFLAFLRFLFEDCGMNKVSLEVLEHNERARRLYHGLGFVLEGAKRQEVWRAGRYQDSLLMSMLRTEYDFRYGAAAQRPPHPAGEHLPEDAPASVDPKAPSPGRSATG